MQVMLIKTTFQESKVNTNDQKLSEIDLKVYLQLHGSSFCLRYVESVQNF